MVQFHWTANLISSCKWLELMHAVREDCLNHKPFSISARFFFHSFWDFFNFLLLHPTSSQFTAKDYFTFYLYPFTAYFYMQRCSKDHYMYMQLKLGDVSRIEIKKMFSAKNICGSHLWGHITCIVGYLHFGGLKSLKKLSFKECVCK